MNINPLVAKRYDSLDSSSPSKPRPSSAVKSDNYILLESPRSHEKMRGPINDPSVYSYNKAPTEQDVKNLLDIENSIY